MISLDTNILLRLLVPDRLDQVVAARTLLLEELSADRPGFVCREVILELAWVLRRSYGFTRAQIATAMNDLLLSAVLEIEAAGDVAEGAWEYRRGGAGFADRMIAAAARRAGAVPLYTFDRKAARLPDVTLVEPLQPASR